MTKYLLKRLLHGLLSVIAVVIIVMVMIYTMLPRDKVFASDPLFAKQMNNARETYTHQKWEEYGYLDYVPYADYLAQLVKDGEIDEETREAAVSIARKEENDSEIVQEYVKKFTEYYQSKGYTVVRKDAVMSTPKKVASGGQQILFAHKDIPLIERVWKYFSGLIAVDNIHNVKDEIEDRGLTFTLHDPAYSDGRFSPAIIGNGTTHRYLLYTDGTFPFIHQNLITIRLGTSYNVNSGVDVFKTMTSSQGAYVQSEITFPTGLTEMSADNLHSATYVSGSRLANKINEDRFDTDYTNVELYRNGMSKMGYSFVIGIISVIMSYLLGVPLGILMARRKDKLIDKLGTFYIVFIIAVPSLAYIFLFKAIGGAAGFPTTFDMESSNVLMYVLPIVSLALPSIANLMKWLRRYMIDQMNSDYVKFARSGGLTEGEIFSKHILKNAIIPIVHGIPGSVLFALTGAIITERVYVVPGAGNLLTEAINKYDNSVIVGVTLFYAILSVVSIILGDLFMSLVDPRISFTTKNR
ncbi:MAG TPA: ABC transporter permease [Ruminococcaceae bacterium]|nr:ABC transporter permease [Oscillospiraceae bacterium]